MPIISLRTQINAPMEIVFDLSRSIDLHKLSTAHTDEEAIAGRLTGLIELHENVTWRAKHFGIYQKLSVKITAYDRPNYFVDEMIQGAFKGFRHEHQFAESQGGTIMLDFFDYESPLGILGVLADSLFLKKYMTGFLEERNKMIKEFAETDQWKEILESDC